VWPFWTSAVKGPKIKTPQEQAQERFEAEYQGIMGLREYALKKRRDVEETLKDHPDLLRDAKRTIDDVLRRHSV
jgi:hypothetical protein